MPDINRFFISLSAHLLRFHTCIFRIEGKIEYFVFKTKVNATTHMNWIHANLLSS